MYSSNNNHLSYRNYNLRRILVSKDSDEINKNMNLIKILNEDDFIIDFKSNEEYILKYLTIDKLDTLLQYMLGNNLEMENYPNKTKYPYISSQVFSIQNELIIDYFFNISKLILIEENQKNYIRNNSTNLDRIHLLINYIKENKQIDHTIAGYLSCVFINLIEYKPKLILKLIIENEDFINGILNNSNCLSISNILKNIINFNNYFLLKNFEISNKENDDINYFIKNQINFISKKIINLYLKTIDIVDELDKNTNLFEILYENLNETKYINTIDNLFLYTEKNFSNILDKIFDPFTKNKIGLIKIMSLILEKVNFSVLDDKDKGNINNKFIEKIKKYSLNINIFNGKVIILTNGMKQITNIKYLYSELFLLNKIIIFGKILYADFDDILIKIEILPHLLNIYKNYPWSNILHQILNKIFYEILDRDFLTQKIINYIFKNDILIDFFNLSKNIFLKNKKIKKIGYMGYIKMLYEHILYLSKNIDFSIDFENNIKWAEFKKTYYDYENKLEEYNLGNLNIEDIMNNSFEFTVKDIKKKYCNFLNLSFKENKSIDNDYLDINNNNESIHNKFVINPDYILNLVNNGPFKSSKNENIQKYDSHNYWKNKSHLKLDLEAVLIKNGLI